MRWRPQFALIWNCRRLNPPRRTGRREWRKYHENIGSWAGGPPFVFLQRWDPLQHTATSFLIASRRELGAAHARSLPPQDKEKGGVYTLASHPPQFKLRNTLH